MEWNDTWTIYIPTGGAGAVGAASYPWGGIPGCIIIGYGTAC